MATNRAAWVKGQRLATPSGSNMSSRSRSISSTSLFHGSCTSREFPSRTRAARGNGSGQDRRLRARCSSSRRNPCPNRIEHYGSEIRRDFTNGCECSPPSSCLRWVSFRSMAYSQNEGTRAYRGQVAGIVTKAANLIRRASNNFKLYDILAGFKRLSISIRSMGEPKCCARCSPHACTPQRSVRNGARRKRVRCRFPVPHAPVGSKSSPVTKASTPRGDALVDINPAAARYNQAMRFDRPVIAGNGAAAGDVKRGPDRRWQPLAAHGSGSSACRPT